MKILKWIAMTVLFVGLSALLGLILFEFSQQYKETSEQTAPVSVPESINNLPMQDIKSDGYYISARLQDAALIDGFPCSAGLVRFTRSGQLSKCVIAEDAVIQGNLIPKNTSIELHEKTHFYYFPKDTNIQGISCVGGKYGLVNIVDVPALFRPSGRLAVCYSNSDITIQGIPCRKTKFGLMSSTPLRVHSLIHLREDGSLMRCTLSRDAEIGGQSISAGTEIQISEDGEVMVIIDSWQRRTRLWVAGIFGY